MTGAKLIGAVYLLGMGSWWLAEIAPAFAQAIEAVPTGVPVSIDLSGGEALTLPMAVVVAAIIVTRAATAWLDRLIPLAEKGLPIRIRIDDRRKPDDEA